MNLENQSNPLFTLTVSQFLDLQMAVLKKVLSLQRASDLAPSNTTEYLNFEASAKYLGISKPTFSKLRKDGKIPCYKVSENRVLFSKSDLDSYVNSQKES